MSLKVYPPRTPVMFGSPEQPMTGHIRCIHIHEDFIRYEIATWIGPEPQSYHLAETDFMVQGDTKRRSVGFHSQQEVR